MGVAVVKNGVVIITQPSLVVKLNLHTTGNRRIIDAILSVLCLQTSYGLQTNHKTAAGNPGHACITVYNKL